MTENKLTRRNPLFSSIALFCVLAGGLLLWRSLGQASAGENLDGYSSFSVAFSFLVALTLTGLVTGQIGLIRGEKPAALAILALLFNALVFLSAIILIPG